MRRGRGPDEKKGRKKMKKKYLKVIAVFAALTIIGGAFTGCGSSSKSSDGSSSSASDTISVLSREEGSGTRGAFIELFGIETKDASGNKVDNTIDSAEVANSTSVMMQTVAGNPAAIGYISLGSLDDSVKALKVDGAEATLANVKNGTYKVSRPFNIVTGKKTNKQAKDFISYILSKEGQKVVADNGYVSEDNAKAFAGGKVSGKIVVAGSSSVTPLMQKLAEAYEKINPNLNIEVQQSDSTTGITSTVEGVCNIGMASRALTDDELSQGVKSTVIATDGIAVIVNKDSSVTDITSDQVLKIYTGKITKWSELK